jgi:uncharacterized cofD-like protein
MENRIRIVTIGGGTGTYTLLTGLKKFPVELSAIVAMSDDGGSSGRLRTNLGVLPPGDVRQALVALSGDEELMLDMLKYRFKDGELKGHNLGNLILSALTKVSGDFETAVHAMSRLFHVHGNVIPVTTQMTNLKVRVNTGQVIIGETIIDDDPPTELTDSIVSEVVLDPPVKITKQAARAIGEADLVVMGPGDFWGSIITNLVVDGMSDALRNTKAKKVFITNLMTRWGQKGFAVSEYTRWIEKYSPIDVVVINNAPLPKEIVSSYAFDNEFPVRDDSDVLSQCAIIHEDLIGKITFEQDTADEIKRSLLRHDAEKLAQTIINLL